MSNDVIRAECRTSANIGRNKWRRNGRVYYGTIFTDVTSARDRTPLGLNLIDYSIEPDIGTTPYYNLVKSIIDTKANRIASNKVRPAILPNGKVNFSTRRKARAFRKAIDRYFQDNKVHSQASVAYLWSLIFERAYLWVDAFTTKTYALFPWEVGTLDIEERFGGTKLLLKFDHFPTSLLAPYTGKKWTEKSLFRKLELFYDTEEHNVEVYVQNKLVRTVPYEGLELPIVKFESTRAMNGARTTSLVDELFGFQELLNHLMAQINETVQLKAAYDIFGPDADSLDAVEISNGNGRYYGVRAGMTAVPFTIRDNRAIDPSWMQVAEMIIKSAFEAVGISQASAQNKNPLGANASGRALETMDNWADERNQIDLDRYVKNQEGVARLIIQTFPEDFELADGVTVKDIKEDYSNLKIEFVSLSWLSRDPQTRYQEIQNLVAQNLIPAGAALELMEFGDLTAAYDKGSARADAIDTCIEKALENEEYEYPALFIHPLDIIKAVQLEMAQEYAQQLPDVEERLSRLQKLLDVLEGYLSSPAINMLTVEPVDTEAAEVLEDGSEMVENVGGQNAPV